MLNATTAPLKYANADHHPPRQPCSRASVAAKNQQYAAPTQTLWNVVFHFAGPMDEIMTPLRFAISRKPVMKISRPSTTTTTHSGSESHMDASNVGKRPSGGMVSPAFLRMGAPRMR